MKRNRRKRRYKRISWSLIWFSMLLGVSLAFLGQSLHQQALARIPHITGYQDQSLFQAVWGGAKNAIRTFNL